MVYKSREIHIEKYIRLLQREYICTEIRYMTYEQDLDKGHFKEVMNKKRNKIESIAEDVGFTTIFNDDFIYADTISAVMNRYGFPNMIYNERVQPDEVKKQYRFPYSGTMVRVGRRIGLTDYVDFDNEKVYVRFRTGELSQPIFYKKVKRLTLAETDRYHYFRSGEFEIKNQFGTFQATGYDLLADEISLFDEAAGMNFMVAASQVRRILNGFTRLDSSEEAEGTTGE